MTNSQIPSFTEQTIADLIDSRSLARGREYSESGTIVQPQVQANRLKAQSYGSGGAMYAVSAEFRNNQIIGSCTCPVGSGACKHIAALLFSWLNDSSQFLSSASLQGQLEALDKAQLIKLIQRMVERQPDLELLVSIAQTSGAKLDSALVKRQVSNILLDAEDSEDYHAARTAAHNILEFADQIRASLGDDNWKTIADLYRIIAEETLSGMDYIYDHDGGLFRVFYACSEWLGDCLGKIDDSAEREPIFRSLYDIIIADFGVGGYGFSDEAREPLLSKSTSAEKQMIAQWLREAQSPIPVNASTPNWRNNALGRLRLALIGDTLTDDEYLALCLETEQVSSAVARMLDLGQVDLALKAARAVGDYELLQLALLFIEHKYDKKLEPIIRERAATSEDSRLDTWLQKYAERNNDWESALTYCKKWYNSRPSLDRYQELLRVAQRDGTSIWQATRDEAIKQLEQNNNFALLISIALSEKQLDLAIQYLERSHTTKGRWGRTAYDQSSTVKVARAIENTHPQKAVEFYCIVAEKLIDVRGRENYKEATTLLKRVKAISLKHDQAAQWQAIITRLRTENKALRAMKDEFNRAGL